MEKIPSQEAQFGTICERVILQAFQDPNYWSGVSTLSLSEIAQQKVAHEVERYSIPSERAVIFQKYLNQYSQEFQKDARVLWGQAGYNGQARDIPSDFVQKWYDESQRHESSSPDGELARHVFATLRLVNEMQEKIAHLHSPKTEAHQRNLGFATLNESVPVLKGKTQPPGRFASTNINATLEDILLANVIVMDGAIPFEKHQVHHKIPTLQSYNSTGYYNQQTTADYISPTIKIEQRNDTGSLYGFHGANLGTPHIHFRYINLLNPINRLEIATGEYSTKQRTVDFHQYFFDGWSTMIRDLELDTSKTKMKKVQQFTQEFAAQFAL